MTAPRAPTPDAAGPTRRVAGAWPVLLAATLATALAEFDETMMAVALPAIAEDFGATLTVVQWAVTAYVLAFACLLIPAGRIADIGGRRRLFLIGAGVLAAGSALCALAPSIGLLIAARVVQGIGAAIVFPASFALVVHAFPAAERGRALGIWTAGVAVGSAIGPLGGGALIELGGWQTIFALGVPIALLAAAVVAVYGQEGQVGEQDAMRAPAPLHVVLLAGALVLALLGLSQVEEGSFLPWGPMLLAAAALVFAALVSLDLRHPSPLLQLRLLRRREYLAVNAIWLLGAIAWLAMLILQGLYLQSVLGLTALEAGALLMPMTIGAIITAPLAGQIADRIGPRTPIVGGLAFILGSLVLLSQVEADTSPWPLLIVAYALNGIGWGMVQTPLDILAVAAAGARRAGFVSGFIGMVYQVGAAIGIATATVAASALAGSRLEDELTGQGIATSPAVRDTLGREQVEEAVTREDVLDALPRLAGAAVDDVLDALRESLAYAVGWTMVLGAALIVVAIVIALVLIRPRRAAPAADSDPPADAGVTGSARARSPDRA